MSQPKTKMRERSMLETFCTTATHMGRREFCIPTYQPEKTKSNRAAGAPQMQMRK